jgi:hypothetical protein
MKCVHKWRLYGSRLEESGGDHASNNSIRGIICMKCGVEQCAEFEILGYESISSYENSWADSFKDTIVKVKNFQLHECTDIAWDITTETWYDIATYKWDNNEEQWVLKISCENKFDSF